MIQTFPLFLRALHWLMAAMILTMLAIGIAMVSSLSDYHDLLAVHRPLGILILVLVAIRLTVRLTRPAPHLPDDMPRLMKLAAHASHFLLYGLMFALPLVGWGMLSAAGYPIVLYGPVHLPPVLPHSDALYALLRPLHTALAFLLFATFLAHLGAALAHAFIFRDGVFQTMAFGRRRTSDEDPAVNAAPPPSSPEAAAPTSLAEG
jgi:cytochrome b561